jgi:antitoxin PrlF
MPHAKVTSKGQVTVPVEIRRALGVETGDTLVFETQADYVTIRRQPTVHEYYSAMRAKNAGVQARYPTDDEAVAAHFREMTEDDILGGDELYVCRFTRESIAEPIGRDDEDS